MSVSVEREEEEGSRLERLSSRMWRERRGGRERRQEGEGFEGGCRACTCKLCRERRRERTVL